MNVIYNEQTDTLLVLNPSGSPSNSQNSFKNTVTVDFDIHGEPVMLEIVEASIMLGMPKEILKKLFTEKKCE